MDFNDVIRRFLGFPMGGRIPPNSSNWDDWASRRNDEYRGEDDYENFCDDESCPNHQDGRDDNEFIFSFGVPDERGGLDGMFEHFHGNMRREMEAIHRQMDEVMKGMGAIDFPSVFNPPHRSRPEIDDSEGQPGNRKGNPFIPFDTPSPFFDNNHQKQKQNPRDFMLKEGVDEQPKTPARKEPKIGPVYVPVDKKQPVKNVDTDLDGKLNHEQILSLVKPPHEPSTLQQPDQRRPHIFSSGSSMTFTTVRGADGKVEQKKVVRNSNGHEETTVTRSLGDQTHTLTTITGEDGWSKEHETLKNMDETNRVDFEKKWSNQSTPPHSTSPTDVLISPTLRPSIDQRDQDIFSRLFNWRDK